MTPKLSSLLAMIGAAILLFFAFIGFICTMFKVWPGYGYNLMQSFIAVGAWLLIGQYFLFKFKDSK